MNKNTEEIMKLLKIRKGLYNCKQKSYIDKRLTILFKEHYRLFHNELRYDGTVINKNDTVIFDKPKVKHGNKGGGIGFTGGKLYFRGVEHLIGGFYGYGWNGIEWVEKMR